MQNKNSNTNVIVTFIVLLIIVVLGMYFLLKPKDITNEIKEVNKETTPEPIVEKTTDQDINKVKTEVKASTKNMEKVAKNGDTLSMNYTGKLTNGTVFDSNVDPKFNHVEPFMFTLGAGQVIKGWDEGLVGMKIGEKKTLTIPYDKAYGEKGYGPIPAKATLIFDVELVDIK